MAVLIQLFKKRKRWKTSLRHSKDLSFYRHCSGEDFDTTYLYDTILSLSRVLFICHCADFSFFVIASERSERSNLIQLHPQYFTKNCKLKTVFNSHLVSNCILDSMLDTDLSLYGILYAI